MAAGLCGWCRCRRRGATSAAAGEGLFLLLERGRGCWNGACGSAARQCLHCPAHCQPCPRSPIPPAAACTRSSPSRSEWRGHLPGVRECVRVAHSSAGTPHQVNGPAGGWAHHPASPPPSPCPPPLQGGAAGRVSQVHGTGRGEGKGEEGAGGGWGAGPTGVAAAMQRTARSAALRLPPLPS